MRITSLLFLSTFVSWVFAAGSAPPTRYHESQRTQLDTERGIKLRLTARGHTETRYLATGLHKRGPPAPAKAIAASKTGTAPNKSPVGAACKRKLHRRSIYDTLVARGECDITLTLTTITDGKETSVTDTFSGENNLGATSMGNEGVYEIAKWGAQNGPFIAKKFKNMGEMETEASFLRVLCQLVAFSPPGSSDSESWIVMKAVPGTYLKQTKEWNDAQSLPVAQYNTFVKGKREALVNEVLRVYDTVKGKLPKATHGDLKDENVHWANQACGTLTPQLLDFGRMWSDNNVQAYLKRFRLPVAAAPTPGWERANVMTYATARAASMYPDRT